MFTSSLLQKIVHVFEILIMTTLIGSHCNGICIFLNGAIDHIGNASIMTKMNNFGTACLNYSSHYINRGIMPIKQGCGSYDADMVLWFIWSYWFHPANLLKILRKGDVYRLMETKKMDACSLSSEEYWILNSLLL